MKSLLETLQALTPRFVEHLDDQLLYYMTIGNGTSESPMWIQLDYMISKGKLRFINSQNSSIGFDIYLEEDQQFITDYMDEIYDYFKYVKYSHIRNNAPKVWQELAIGFNGARINSFMNSYKPPFIQVKSKIEQLVEDGVISIKDILEYANDYHIDKYYQEEYSEWESNDPNAPDYYDTQDVEWPTHFRSSDPEYIIASTSYRMEETYIFESDSNGKILDMGEYGGLAKRWDNDNWEDHQAAVLAAMGDIPYRFEREIQTGTEDVRHFLYSKINPADYWDGE